MAVQKIIRKKSKAKVDPLAKQKIIWTAGHGLTLACGAIYAVFYLFQCLTFYRYRSWKTLFLIARPPINKPKTWLKWLWRLFPQISYRLSVIGVFLSYGVTSYQNWNALNPSWYDLLSKENFQSILIACLWLFSRATIFKLIPFMLTSYLHLTVKENESEEKESSAQNTQLLHVIAYSELIVAGILFLDTISFKGASGFVLALYLAIYWLRLNFSPYAQVTLLRLVVKLDKKVPPKFESQWKQVKEFLYLRMDESKKKRAEIAKPY
ncbi:hypothetical protein ACU8KH_05389 [Lachancea thermotolerans]